MERIEIFEAVQRMQDYIKFHITELITLENLAKSAGYSPWHANRIFKELTKKTPFEYIRALRLSEAALKLRDEKNKITDVAFDFVFGSHEGFTRAFSKQSGMPPKKYRQQTPPIPLFLPNSIYDYYLLTKKKGEKNMSENKITKSIFVQVIKRPQRKILLKRGINAKEYFAYCEEVGCDVWGVLSSVKEALYEPAGFWLPKHLIKPCTSEYVQGVELPLDYNNLVPDGFEILILPACMMMVFQGEPYDDENFDEAIDEVWNMIEKYNPELYGFSWAKEDAPKFQLIPQGYRGYIEARPVRPINTDYFCLD